MLIFGYQNEKSREADLVERRVEELNRVVERGVPPVAPNSITDLGVGQAEELITFSILPYPSFEKAKGMFSPHRVGERVEVGEDI